MLETRNKLLSLIYTPNDVAAYTTQVIKARHTESSVGLQTGVRSLDAILMPLLPAELVIIMARPSNYKSGFMQAWARNVVAQIDAREEAHKNSDGKPREVVVFCTWEMSVEELGFYDVANRTGLSAHRLWYGHATPQDLETVEAAAMKRACSPIWLLGHSLSRRKEQHHVTLTNISNALCQAEQTWNVRPAIIFLDYLQQIDPERGEDRRMQVLYNVDRAKELAREMACPVVLACQAGRAVDGREFGVPELGDGQETSRIEQAADKFLGLWMPKTSFPDGHYLTQIGMRVTRDMLVASLRKQRMGESGQVVVLSVNPVTNTIIPYTERTQHVPENRVVGSSGT